MSIRDRTAEFCKRYGLRVPILLAPMAGASAPALSIAVANAGGLGACGALLMRKLPKAPAQTWWSSRGNPGAKGHCGDPFKADKQATTVLMPGAPHTLLNIPAARHSKEGFLRDLLGM